MLLAATVASAITGCGKLTPNGEATAFALLQQGSPKVCVAPEVQTLLRDMLAPKTGDIGAGDVSQKQAGIRSVSFAFEMTTLQSADKAVSKAQCHTSLKVSGPQGATRIFPLPFQVLPAAEGDGSIVVSAVTEPAKAYAAELALSHVEDAIATNYNAQEDARMATERTKLLATVTPKWLVGTWIMTNEDSLACAEGRDFVFRADRTGALNGHSFRWSLSDGNLHIVGSGFDRTIALTQADSISLTADYNGNRATMRRCTQEEIDVGADFQEEGPGEPSQ